MYHYVVTAVNFFGESRASQEVAGSLPGTAPSGPTDVAMIAGDKQMTIRWKAVEGATSYNIYWSTAGGGSHDRRNKIEGVSSPYLHGGLTNGTMYRYVVTAVNFYGESRVSREVADIPRTVPGKARTRVVWVQDLGDGRDGDTLGSNLRLMGLDTGDGKGERAILGMPGNYSKPLIAPRGDRVVYSDRHRKQVFVVNWDGSGLRALTDGFGLAVWRDPRDGREWLYYGYEEKMEGGFHCRAVYRKTLDSPGKGELVWDKVPVNIDSFQLSVDGRIAGGNIPWPEGGVAQLPNMSMKVYTKGCWTALATVNGKPFHWIFDGAHRNLTLVDVEKETKWQVRINGAPGIDGHEVYNPRWGNHPRVIALTGPYGGKWQIRDIEVHIGRFNADFTAIESWRRVTNNDRADYYPDVWLSP
jgi:hypothetical protein